MRALATSLLLAVLVAATPAGAVEPGEILKDPVLEDRAREISKVLRCLVCQNQSIDDSNAQLARDLRLIVRERLVAGDSNDQVIDFVTDRYGDFVLLKPPFKPITWVLWLGPAAILIAGIAAVLVFARRRRVLPNAEPAPLSADEERRIARLLDENDPEGGSGP